MAADDFYCGPAVEILAVFWGGPQTFTFHENLTGSGTVKCHIFGFCEVFALRFDCSLGSESAREILMFSQKLSNLTFLKPEFLVAGQC